MITIPDYLAYLTHAITTGLAQHMRRCDRCEAPLLGSVGAVEEGEEYNPVPPENSFTARVRYEYRGRGEPLPWIETEEDALAHTNASLSTASEETQTLSAIGRLCGVCGAYDCQRAHVIRPSVSLPTKAVQEVAQLEETQVNYWDTCKRCGLVLAYCKCH